MKNTLKFLLFALIFFTAGYFLGQSAAIQKVEAPVVSEEQSGVIEPVNLMLDDGTADLLIYNNVEIAAGDTAFSVLQKLSEENNFILDFDPPGEWGVFIKQISGKKNGEDNKYWQYFVNNGQPMAAADRYELQGGEVIMFKFMESKF